MSTIETFIRRKGWNFVPLTEAGGIKVLVSDDPADAVARQHLIARIRQEVSLHHPPIIAFSVHRDCGAYGYFKAFDNDLAKESERLYADMAKAKDLLEKEFGDQARIEGYVFDREGAEEVVF